VRLLASGGTAEGIEVADIVALITRVAGIDGEAVSDVKLLERFALLSVPATEVDRVLETVSGEQVRGHELRLERVQA
jgi:ATP-dependent RNA helicase DeaD